jgi:DNA replication protein DnaC
VLLAGEPLSPVSAQLGHKSPEITLRVYSHWIPGTKRLATHALDCRSAQDRALSLMRKDPDGNFYLTGAYGNGKTHLLYAQYRDVVISGKVRCHVRTTRELIEELRRAEFDDDFVSPVIAAASRRVPYHLFWDDIDKLKVTDFKTEVLFDLVDSLYRQKHGLTVTGNYSMRDLVEGERMHPAIIRRLDDMCRVVEL